jgi:hypothetical protein
MSSEYKNNHYVPQWYQEGFIPIGAPSQELFYLDLNPGFYTNADGREIPRREIKKLGTKYCFAEDDLYTKWFGATRSTTIESRFFGLIDDKGKASIEYFANYDHRAISYDAFQNMLPYMGAQKLRTPKGLDWIQRRTGVADRDVLLDAMIRFRDIFSAIWTECIWQIADATESDTKFIISDHPVTVYNREIGTHNRTWKRENDDPDIYLTGTHTIFPLTLEKVLILTNLNWARNPYQSGMTKRPNSNPFRGAVFNYTEIQVERHLSEEEVKQINFIIKSRAHKYIAAAREEWLYPERDINPGEWNTFGDGILLMPDPRSLNLGGQVFIGYRDGTSAAFDEYGRRPGDPDYNDSGPINVEFDALYKFKGEFAHRFGAKRRGRKSDAGTLEPQEEGDSMHEYHLSLYKPRGSEAKRIKLLEKTRKREQVSNQSEENEG